MMIDKRGVYDTIKSFCNLKNSKGSENFVMDSDLINHYFISINTKDKLSLVPESFIKHASLNIPNSSFKLRCITSYELHMTWKNMKKKTSNSIDFTNLSPRMIHLSIEAPNISEYLLRIVNTSLISNEVPDVIKVSKVIPIAKV